MSSSLVTINLQTHESPSLSLTIAPGELVCLTGISGCGKSLLLRAIADLDLHLGDVFFADQNANTFSPPIWRKKIGLLQPTSYWWSDVVRAHFAKPEIALPIMARLEIPSAALDWRVERMSTGERQRMSIVRLLANRPAVLLLDEPTANLDPTTSLLVESLIADYKAENSSPVLWVSHDLLQVKRIADRHLTIVGKTIEEAPLE